MSQILLATCYESGFGAARASELSDPEWIRSAVRCAPLHARVTENSRSAHSRILLSVSRRLLTQSYPVSPKCFRGLLPVALPLRRQALLFTSNGGFADVKTPSEPTDRVFGYLPCDAIGAVALVTRVCHLAEGTLKPHAVFILGNCFRCDAVSWHSLIVYQRCYCVACWVGECYDEP